MFIIGGGVGTARAATCDAGYTMDETDGLCKITCSPGYYVKSPGDKCIAINNNYSIAYVDSEHTVIYGETSGDNVKSCPNTIKYSDMFIAFNAWNPPADLHTSIEGCRILLYGPDDGFGQYKLSCEYNPATGDYDKSCGESYSDTRTCIAGYKYLGSNRTDTCKAMSQGYCKISCGDSVYGCMNHRCTVVGYGRYSPSDELGWYNCPNGTYTTTETAAAASDCTPCTNAPANAHYTAANTTDGTPNCEWECDAGFGHTSDDRCLP
ncbi:MAG: hypothetical protein IJ560_04230, partial [Alphaproteobacteria bacterium]|nr:hypothetical protein [Alphaproteobacteria bacterium]